MIPTRQWYMDSDYYMYIYEVLTLHLMRIKKMLSIEEMDKGQII